MKFDLEVWPGVPRDLRQDAGITTTDETTNPTASRRPNNAGKINVTLHRRAGHDEFPRAFQCDGLSMALLYESAHGEDVVAGDVEVLGV